MPLISNSTYQLPFLPCVVSGRPIKELPVNFLKIKAGLVNFSPLPKISSLRLKPKLHHHSSPCLKTTFPSPVQSFIFNSSQFFISLIKSMIFNYLLSFNPPPTFLNQIPDILLWKFRR